MSVRPSTYRPRIEQLEERELLAGSIQAYLADGNLYILGSAGNNSITVTQNRDQISVAGTTIAVNGSQASSVSTSQFGEVIIYSNGGNDNIDFSTVKVNTIVYAGSGNDTIRCGSDSDTVNNGGGFDTMLFPLNLNAPVVNGLNVSDIHQGQSPLCQTVAALAEAAQQGRNLAQNITDLGNGYYQVKLYNGLGTQKVHFEGWTTSNDPVPAADGAFWPLLLQRARLQALGIDPNQNYSAAQWDAFNQHTGGRLYSIGDALSDFVGGVSTIDNVSALTPQQLQSALSAGQYVVAQSHAGTNYVSSDGIVGDHAYAVLSVYYEAGVWKVRLYNPWGVDSVNGRTLDSLDKSHPPANDGYITLNWQQFTNSANFAQVYLAGADKK